MGGQDFEEVFALVVNDVTFRIWLVLVMLWKVKTIVFGIEVAFLNGELEHEIFMECPEGLEHSDDEVLQLLKTIY